MTRILIAEDEARIASFLEKGLRANGFTTMTVSDGMTASAVARDVDFDLLLLDLGLPGTDGFNVLEQIRQRGERLPVIVLTARGSVPDRVAGLERGADDYVTKPFSFEELLARVRVRLRDGGTAEETVLGAGTVTLDLRTRRATVADRTVELTAREFTLLEMFLRHRDQVLSREQLLSHVWGYDFDPGSNVVDVYVRYLRKKLGNDTIETVRGMGYRLAAGNSVADLNGVLGTVGSVTIQDGVRSRLRTGLTTAMKARDMAAVKAIRSALGAIDNAESVDTTVDADQIDATSRIAGAVAGGGAAEARRRELTEADIITVVRSEIDDRLDAAADYDATGDAGAERAALLRAEASTLAGFITPSVDAGR